MARKHFLFTYDHNDTKGQQDSKRGINNDNSINQSKNIDVPRSPNCPGMEWMNECMYSMYNQRPATQRPETSNGRVFLVFFFFFATIPVKGSFVGRETRLMRDRVPRRASVEMRKYSHAPVKGKAFFFPSTTHHIEKDLSLRLFHSLRFSNAARYGLLHALARRGAACWCSM
ncbi:hypothetical protein F4803DRAFT_108702 [Xylaria telfairii]|nr:hypothetical protein F4803DRAFT_108702 [Xylaria telfairii]